jgi:hypothetical protein
VVVAGNFMAGVRASAGAASPAVRDVLHRLITCYLSKHAIESASGVAIVSPPYVLAYTCAPAALALAGLLPTSSVADITALHSASIQALSSYTVALVESAIFCLTLLALLSIALHDAPCSLVC